MGTVGLVPSDKSGSTEEPGWKGIVKALLMGLYSAFLSTVLGFFFTNAGYKDIEPSPDHECSEVPHHQNTLQLYLGLDGVRDAIKSCPTLIRDNRPVKCPKPCECCDPGKPPEPPPKPRDPIPPPEPDTTSKAKEIGRVCFVKNSLNYVKCSDHSGDAEQQLECVQKSLTHLHSSRAPVVEGHADPLGLPSHNLNLSQRRAQQVAEHLRKEGNRPFEIVAKGESHDTPFPDEQNTRKRMVRVLAYCDQHTAAGVPQPSQTPRSTECEVPNSNEADPCET